MTYTYQEAFDASLEYFKGDELAANVFVTKYALVDDDGKFLETTPDQMHHRIAKEFHRIEQKYENSMSYEEIYELLDGFKYIIPQGSPMSGIGNKHRLQSLSNCFVIDSPADSYGGILKIDQELVQIAKRRGGVGFDLSTIRPKGCRTANAARTTDGIEVFMDRFSNSCREVAQGGRRGALMLTISVHHPQIMDFIKIKRDLTRVTGANISVRVTDDFMNSVKNDDLYIVQWPVDTNTKKEKPLISRLKNAREVWDALIEGAHSSAEPGILFWDTAKRMTPADIYSEEGFGSISTNPCGEIILSPYDSCRLMLVNLTSFIDDPWTSEAKFDYVKFRDVVIKAQRLMDDMVDLEIEQINKILLKITNDPEDEEVKAIELRLWNKILEQARNGRRTGLGITGLGDTLAMLNLRYGSLPATKETEEIYSTLAMSSYYSSCVLAGERGAFPIFDNVKEQGHPFLDRIFKADARVLRAYKKWGRRNIALTTTAPAGSVSVLTQTTSGIEPAFMLHYTRRKKLTAQDLGGKIDFIDDSGDKWQEYTVYHHGFKKWMDKNTDPADLRSVEELVELSPYAGSTANEIDWPSKVDMQAAAQKWVCHAISNTTNLPADVGIETVKDVYMKGWELGCKGITVYREGSRSGVLVSSESSSTQDDPRSAQEIIYQSAPKRPDDLTCDIHQANIKGEAWTILIGLMKGRPYEVMGGLSQYVEIPRKYSGGTIRKRLRKSMPSKYDLVFGENGDEVVIKDMVKVFDNPNHGAFTRTISLALRHGVPIQYIVEQLQKDRNADLFSFSKVIARCLKKYIVDGTRVSNGVIECGCEKVEDCNIIYQEGCATCLTCGMAKCG